MTGAISTVLARLGLVVGLTLAISACGTSPAPTAAPTFASGSTSSPSSPLPAASSPTASSDLANPSSTPTTGLVVGPAHFAGEGFGFDYPADWEILSAYQHYGIHGPTIFAAVGHGSIDSGCTVSSTGGTHCGPSPIWTLPSDGMIAAYHIGAWLGPIAPMPTPLLGPGEAFDDVGGRQAIFKQTPYGSMIWTFVDAPDLIEIRWGRAFAQDAPSIANALIRSWRFDPSYEP